MILICKRCGDSFYEKPARIRDGKGKYCSQECYDTVRREHFNKVDKIKSLYKKGLTLREIASRFKCSPTSVKNIMIENNIPRRDAHDREYDRGEKHSRWRGGRSWGAHIYRMVRTPEGRKYEHRLVVEEALGRKLKPTEHVHHVDFNPRNNSLDNLTVMDGKEHLAMHYELRRAT